MRIRTERRLVLALLACSLLPLGVLGALGALGFTRLGRELTAAQSGLVEARARQTALGAALRAADRAAALLQRARADLRFLAHLPPDPPVYQEFCRTHLAPVRTGSPDPGTDPPELGRITLGRRDADGAGEGMVWVDLDLRHMESLLSALPVPVCLVFFDERGAPYRIGAPLAAAGVLTPGSAAGSDRLGVRWVDTGGTVAAAVPFRSSPTEMEADLLGYAVAEIPPVDRAAETRAVETLAGRYTRLAVLLTVLTAGAIAAVALLVARRALRPWARLRERVDAVAPGRSGEPDDLSAIAETVDSLAREVEQSTGKLLETETRFREFFEMAPDGVAVLDPDGRVLHANSAFFQILRRPPGRARGLSAREVLAEPRVWPAVVARVRQRQRIKNYQLPLRRADGRSVAALWSLRLALVDGREQIEAVVRDISGLIEAQEREREKTEDLFRVYGELQRARERLGRYEGGPGAGASPARADRTRAEALMQMSHEIRTPLNCIIGYSEAMIQGLDGPLTPDQTRSLERIADSGRRLLRLIENILDLSRIESGRLEIAPCPVDLRAVADAVLHQVRALAAGRPIEFSLRAAPEVPPAWADPDRVAQILFNLLGNAVKFTERGEVRVEIRPAGPTHLQLTVADTGPGVPPGERERIFEKFARGTHARPDGAGIGLAICRELVERMGGTIWVESEPGRGSVFGFTLPRVGPTIDAGTGASV